MLQFKLKTPSADVDSDLDEFNPLHPQTIRKMDFLDCLNDTTKTFFRERHCQEYEHVNDL